MNRNTVAQSEKRQRRFLMILLIILSLIVVAICFLYAERQEYPKQYGTYVERYAEQYDFPPHLIYALIHTESGFDSGAQSAAGAVGLMQLTPSTFRWLSDSLLKEKLDDGMILDPETNIRYGCYYLNYLYRRYQDVATALAAYNAGPGRVDSWLNDPTLIDDSGALIPECIPFTETRRYVTAVLNTAQIYDRLYPNSTESASFLP